MHTLNFKSTKYVERDKTSGIITIANLWASPFKPLPYVNHFHFKAQFSSITVTL